MQQQIVVIMLFIILPLFLLYIFTVCIFIIYMGQLKTITGTQALFDGDITLECAGF